jgi:hypothetical protein
MSNTGAGRRGSWYCRHRERRGRRGNVETALRKEKNPTTRPQRRRLLPQYCGGSRVFQIASHHTACQASLFKSRSVDSDAQEAHSACFSSRSLFLPTSSLQLPSALCTSPSTDILLRSSPPVVARLFDASCSTRAPTPPRHFGSTFRRLALSLASLPLSLVFRCCLFSLVFSLACSPTSSGLCPFSLPLPLIAPSPKSAPNSRQPNCAGSTKSR